MIKFFEKHETLICILLIVLYVAANSFCVQVFGDISYMGLVVNTALSLSLVLLMFALKRVSYYGLTKANDPKSFLYFIPLIPIISVNLWNGININNSTVEIVLHILTMFNIGFIEEIIFRGFLFKMMAKSNLKSAIAVSALTFGIGHIANLLNGADLVPTLLQICYAISIGYLFVIIFIKSRSLIPCIITHCSVNALSVFNTETPLSLYISSAFLIIFPLAYAFYINVKTKDKHYKGFEAV